MCLTLLITNSVLDICVPIPVMWLFQCEVFIQVNPKNVTESFLIAFSPNVINFLVFETNIVITKFM